MIAKPKTQACRAWASGDLAIRYPDEEWDEPAHDDRTLFSSFWKERSICKTTAPITSANVESRCQPTSRHSFTSAVAPVIGGVTNTQGTYLGYMSISAATSRDTYTLISRRSLETRRTATPRKPKEGK